MTGHGETEIGLSLGSNLGRKVENIRRALDIMEADGLLQDPVVSSLYRTAPWGHVVDQDWFVNACAVGITTLNPADFLCRIKWIEREIGRSETVRWGPRVIDIDILYYGALKLETPGLTLPHKEILGRAFVLVPLAEIRPDHVIGGVTVRAAALALGPSGVDPLGAEDIA